MKKLFFLLTFLSQFVLLPAMKKPSPQASPRQSSPQASPRPVKEVQEEELRIAARNEDLKKVKELLAKGVDVNAANYDGFTPLMCVVSHPRRLDEATKNVITVLLDAGAQVNLMSLSQQTALSLLIAGVGNNKKNFIYRETVTLLVKKGADPNLGRVYDEKGVYKTILSYLQNTSHNKNLAAFLIRHGAKE